MRTAFLLVLKRFVVRATERAGVWQGWLAVVIVMGSRFFLGGGVGDAGGTIGVDRGEGAQEEAADERENGGAASVNAVGGKQFVEGGEGEVDALSGLKSLAVGQENLGEICGVSFGGQVLGAKAGARIGGKQTTLAAFGGAIRTTEGKNCGGFTHGD